MLADFGISVIPICNFLKLIQKYILNYSKFLRCETKHWEEKHFPVAFCVFIVRESSSFRNDREVGQFKKNVF